jgi:hypothetical protein
MIQIDIDTMSKLKQTLQSMKPFRIDCMKSLPQLTPLENLNQVVSNSSSSPDNMITIEWNKSDRFINRDVFSVIDGRSLCGVKSLRLTNTYDYVSATKAIRWTEIFLISIEDDAAGVNENSFNLNRFADMCSTACCTALAPLLDDLAQLQQIFLQERKSARSEIKQSMAAATASALSNRPCKILSPFKVALRVQVNGEQVGYLLGMNGKQITEEKYLAGLDNEIIQLLHHANSYNINILLELVFCIQEKFNSSNSQFYNAK